MRGMRTWKRARLVYITGYDKEDKEIVKEVVFPFQYHETLEKVKKNAGIERINIKENYTTY